MLRICQDAKTLRFWKKLAFGCSGVIAALFSALRMITFVPYFKPYEKSILSPCVFLLMLLASVAVGIWMVWPREIKIKLKRPSTTISIVEGNIFDQKTNLVIGVTRAFDTMLPDVIDETSLLGQAIKRFYSDHGEKLQAIFSDGLKDRAKEKFHKEDGNNEKVEIGTVLAVKHESRMFFFTAYCDVDKTNKASSNTDWIFITLTSLWREVRSRGNARPVSIAVWGKELARMSHVLTESDAIKLIILSFVFASRSEPVCSELKIVLQKDAYEAIDRLEFQAFLNSVGN
ncbi:TPA: hypothetical protein UME34_000398 [Stenotrophomonas maltophilia]|nr:hypothetical protein [Stenotrophomonas maltophilia]